MDKQIKSFMEFTEKSRAKIDNIANALKATQFEHKTAEKSLADGSKQQVFQMQGRDGKPVYVASRDDKNTMTFSTKKQLMDYLDE